MLLTTPWHCNAGAGSSSVKIERDAWMVSGKVKFGGPVDSPLLLCMDADDLEVSCSGGGIACTATGTRSAAEAWNVGLFYTMPGGTELRLTYSEVDIATRTAGYGQGISGTGLGNRLVQ